MLKIKPGVVITGISTPMTVAIMVAHEFCNTIKVDCVITSGTEGKHSINSKHYNGDALDFRTRDMTSLKQKMFHETMRDALGKDYYVLLESNHLHVEYEPKRR